MRIASEIMIDNEEPLELSAAMRSEVSSLFAPMDRSLASSVTAAIGMRRSRRRLLQSLWLGFSPVMAIVIVAVLYVGGAVLPRTLSLATSGAALLAPNPEFRIADATPKGFFGSQGSAVLGTARSFRVMLEGDVARRQLLVMWLRVRHADVALELDAAVPGGEVALTLEPDEVRGFASLMALHGFIGEAPSGLRILPRFSPQSWSRSLGTSSLFICVIP